jgi:hypothetical protein
MIRECRRKHGLALIPDEKAKVAKKKNLQAIRFLSQPCQWRLLRLLTKRVLLTSASL